MNSNQAVKFDGAKPPLSMLPDLPLFDVAQVLAFGAQKYGRDNWRKGMSWSRLIDAALRHIRAHNRGEDVDPESGLNHLAHAVCCILFLLQYSRTHTDLDDRYKEQGPDITGE